MIEQKKVERSQSYPIIDLEGALMKVFKVNQNLGASSRYSRETIAIAMGYTSLNGTSVRNIAALLQYGLLERVKGQYGITDLAKRYLFPTKDEDKTDAIKEAAIKPRLFNEIYDELKGQRIPNQFQNILYRKFHIQQSATAQVENIFKRTMEFARILDDNEILGGDMSNFGSSTENAPVASVIDQSSYPSSSTVFPNRELQRVVLPSGIIIEYHESLASAFAFGQFSQELKALDAAIDKYNKKEKKYE